MSSASLGWGAAGYRWLKFNLVGAIGIAVQLTVLSYLKSVLGLSYMFATAVAVECAVIHNFVWHISYTWRDRQASRVVTRLMKFQLMNGLISVVGNLVLMRLLTGQLKLHFLLANVLSILVCSATNFLAGDRVVFR